ncbi:MAG TPA: hypothetical protein VKE30_08945 [Chthoniobacterales bacterium]|nr:hypothetical protein [Chthoniobacterales bacterium]
MHLIMYGARIDILLEIALGGSWLRNICSEKRHITMPLAFDLGWKAHDSLGVSGVPAIVVFDREGKIRLTREGYNSAETSFRRDLVEFLKRL